MYLYGFCSSPITYELRAHDVCTTTDDDVPDCIHREHPQVAKQRRFGGGEISILAVIIRNITSLGSRHALFSLTGYTTKPSYDYTCTIPVTTPWYIILHNTCNYALVYYFTQYR